MHKRIIDLWGPKGSAGQYFFVVPEHHLYQGLDGYIHGIDQMLLVDPGIAHGTISTAAYILPSIEQNQLAQREDLVRKLSRGCAVQKIMLA